MKPQAKVSVIVITYNQENYIREALDGFVAQKTDFAFEVLIGDDCSTDKTPSILDEYAKKYPKTIFPIHRKKNMGAWQNFTDVIKRAKGDYITLCEGDDYWTDPTKLQQQVNYMDSHKSYSLCFHPVKVLYENTDRYTIFPETSKTSDFILEKLLKANFIQTNSVMYRRQDYSQLPNDIMPGDWYMHLYHARFGKIGFINKVMSVYRRHSEGLWWESQNDISKIWRKHGIGHMKLYQAMMKLFVEDKSLKKIIDQHIEKMLDNIINLPDAEALQLKLVSEVPEIERSYIHYLYLRYSRGAEEIKIREIELEKLHQQSDVARQKIETLENELHLIKTSRIWKLRNRIARVIGKEKV
jgi:glycosyltransferase involved in cell wall biosynthesis